MYEFFPGNYRWSYNTLLAVAAGGQLGDIALIHPRLLERAGEDEAWHEEWARLADILTQNNQPVWDGGAELCRAFEAIPSILLDRSPEDGETRLKVAINAMMLSLIDRMSEQVPTLDPDLSTSQHTVAIFLRRLALALEEDWSLEGMAEECGLSRTRFADHCKKLTNMAPRQYLQHLRLEQASRLLQDPRKTSVTEIALSCGFNSSQYFSNAFKRRYGHSPSSYR